MAQQGTISMTPTPVGDTAVEILLGYDVRRVRWMAAAILADLPPGVVDVVPALDRVMVVYDIGRIESVHDLVARLEIVARSSAAGGPAAEPQLHEVPVCYGGEHGHQRHEGGNRPAERPCTRGDGTAGRCDCSQRQCATAGDDEQIHLESPGTQNETS
jgi:hypothetical protein